MPLLPAAYHCDENNYTYKYKHITIVAKKKYRTYTSIQKLCQRCQYK